jgi:post-segregation antitoxin (ccd killing protein)
LKLEREIWKATHKQGVFGCFEVTIGWFGKERVDFITYDTKGIWRCYEIKVSKSDFRSKAHNTFIGHYNYYVMPQELYEQVKDEIPHHIGVYVNGSSVKRAKKQELDIDEQTLKDSLIRSLYREYEKQYKSGNPTAIESLNRRLRRSETEKENYQRQYWELMRIGQEKYGSRWYRE